MSENIKYIKNNLTIPCDENELSALILLLSLIPKESRVLQVGCQDGLILSELQKNLSIYSFGLDTSESNINSCKANGINEAYQISSEKDILGLRRKKIEYIVFTYNIDSFKNPVKTIRRALKVAPYVIVIFHNYGHWKHRLHYLLKGYHKNSDNMSWYDTNTKRAFNIDNFYIMCSEKDFFIQKALYLDPSNNVANALDVSKFPNFFGKKAAFMISGDSL